MYGLDFGRFRNSFNICTPTCIPDKKAVSESFVQCHSIFAGDASMSERMQLKRLALLLWWKKRRRNRKLARLILMALIRPDVERPLVPDVRFSLHEITDADAILYFRFNVQSILRLNLLSKVPNVIV